MRKEQTARVEALPMADRQLTKVLHDLSRRVAAPDRELLERFLHQRDETAFAALVERTVPVICWLTATSMVDTAFKAVHDGPRS